MEIHSDAFRAMAERVLVVTALTSRLDALPFEDEQGRAALLAQVLGRPLPPAWPSTRPSAPVTFTTSGHRRRW